MDKATVIAIGVTVLVAFFLFGVEFMSASVRLARCEAKLEMLEPKKP